MKVRTPRVVILCAHDGIPWNNLKYASVVRAQNIFITAGVSRATWYILWMRSYIVS